MTEMEIANYLMELNNLKTQAKEIEDKIIDMTDPDEGKCKELREYFISQFGEEKGIDLADILTLGDQPADLSEFKGTKNIYFYEFDVREVDIVCKKVNAYMFKHEIKFITTIKNAFDKRIVISTNKDAEWYINDLYGFLFAFKKDNQKAIQKYYESFNAYADHLKEEHADVDGVEEIIDQVEYTIEQMEEKFNLE